MALSKKEQEYLALQKKLVDLNKEFEKTRKLVTKPENAGALQREYEEKRNKLRIEISKLQKEIEAEKKKK
jgi:hypothetical protein